MGRTGLKDYRSAETLTEIETGTTMTAIRRRWTETRRAVTRAAAGSLSDSEMAGEAEPRRPNLHKHVATVNGLHCATRWKGRYDKKTRGRNEGDDDRDCDRKARFVRTEERALGRLVDRTLPENATPPVSIYSSIYRWKRGRTGWGSRACGR
jgi:hypothetical protein